MFVKRIFKQFEAEIGPSLPQERGEAAEPIGTMVSMVFARPEYHFNGRSLIDILWAKYHVECRLLFGVPGGVYKHSVSDLAAGFAAITLRDYRNHRTHQNPAPNRLFWQSLARVTNTPAQELNIGHYQAVGSMLNHTFVTRFVQLYGMAAVVAIKYALVDFPNRAPQNPTNQKEQNLKKEAEALHSVAYSLDQEAHLKL